MKNVTIVCIRFGVSFVLSAFALDRFGCGVYTFPPGRQEQCPFTTRLRVLKLFTLSYRDLERLQGVTTDNVYGNSFAHPISCQEYLEVLRIVDRVTIECDQDITEHESTFFSGAILVHFDDEQAMLLRLPGPLSVRQADQLAANAQVAALDVTLLDQGIGDVFGNVHGDSQCNTVDQSSGQNADDGPLHIDERPSRETGVGRCIGADVTFESYSSAGAQRPSDNTDNARTGHWPIVRRSAYCHDHLTNPRRLF